jgi:hypothetical protein
MRTLLVVLFLTVAGGCASDRTYMVRVRNNTPEPITVGFTKDGPVFEDRWASPEVLSDLPQSRMPPHWGVVIEQGQIRILQIVGKFDSGTHAFLRVYTGAATASDLLAKSNGLGTRLDLLLNPKGDNDFVIGEDQRARLTAHLRRYASGP